MAFTFAGQYGPEVFESSSRALLRSQAVDVYLPGTTTRATLYTDRTKTATASNPFTTDAQGNGTFFAEPGQYDVHFGGVTLSVTVPVDPVEENTDIEAVIALQTAHAAAGDPHAGYLTEAAASGTYAALTSALAPAALPARLRPVDVALTEPGHTWAADGFGSSNLNDTAVFTLGTQSIRLTTDGLGSSGTPARATKTDLVIDGTGKIPVLWIRAADATKLKGLAFYLGSGASWANFYLWDFQAIGSPVDSTSWYATSGDWVAITLPFDTAAVTGAPNRAALTRARFAAVDNGAATTVYLNGIGMVPEPAAYPNGVVSVTFDDSYVSHWSLARPVMDPYGFGATTYQIAEVVDTSGYCTSDNLLELQRTHGWEIAAHAMTAAAHDARFTSLTDAALDAELSSLKAWLLSRGFRGADDLAWPGGVFDKRTIDIARRYFHIGRTTIKLSRESVPPSDRMKVRAFNVLSTTTTAAIAAEVDKAYTNKSHLVLIFHRIVSGAVGSTIDYTQANFATVMAYLNTKGIPVRTMAEVAASV